MIFSPDAEKTILGAILLDNEAFDVATEKLTPSDFALDSHQRIFARIGELISSGQPVDTVTLLEALTQKGEVSSIGGVSYIPALLEGLPRRLNIDRNGLAQRSL